MTCRYWIAIGISLLTFLNLETSAIASAKKLVSKKILLTCHGSTISQVGDPDVLKKQRQSLPRETDARVLSFEDGKLTEPHDSYSDFHATHCTITDQIVGCDKPTEIEALKWKKAVALIFVNRWTGLAKMVKLLYSKEGPGNSIFYYFEGTCVPTKGRIF